MLMTLLCADIVHSLQSPIRTGPPACQDSTDLVEPGTDDKDVEPRSHDAPAKAGST